MNAKNQVPDLRSEKTHSAGLLIWVISGFYLLVMVWLLLTTGKYGTHEFQPWLASAVTGSTVAYGILMLWLWPNEEASTTAQMGQPAKL
jgi:hypothetical protein